MRTLCPYRRYIPILDAARSDRRKTLRQRVPKACAQREALTHAVGPRRNAVVPVIEEVASIGVQSLWAKHAQIVWDNGNQDNASAV